MRTLPPLQGKMLPRRTGSSWIAGSNWRIAQRTNGSPLLQSLHFSILSRCIYPVCLQKKVDVGHAQSSRLPEDSSHRWDLEAKISIRPLFIRNTWPPTGHGIYSASAVSASTSWTVCPRGNKFPGVKAFVSGWPKVCLHLGNRQPVLPLHRIFAERSLDS